MSTRRTRTNKTTENANGAGDGAGKLAAAVEAPPDVDVEQELEAAEAAAGVGSFGDTFNLATPRDFLSQLTQIAKELDFPRDGCHAGAVSKSSPADREERAHLLRGVLETRRRLGFHSARPSTTTCPPRDIFPPSQIRSSTCARVPVRDRSARPGGALLCAHQCRGHHSKRPRWRAEGLF